MTPFYPISYVFANASELLHELKLPNEVRDVKSFGYTCADGGDGGLIFVELLERNEDGRAVGTVRHERFVTRDISYEDWGQSPAEYTRP